MKKKSLFGAILSLSLAATLAFPSGANAEIIKRYSEDPPKNKQDHTTFINIHAGGGHVKFWWNNFSNSKVNLTVKHVSSGHEYISTEIGPGPNQWISPRAGINQGMRAGLYEITYSSGQNLNIDFEAISGTNAKDVDR